jgi:hypothetical protein
MRPMTKWQSITDGPTEVKAVNSVKLAAITWRITGAENPSTQAPQVSTVVTGGSLANTAQSGIVTPTGGAKDYLFLTMMSSAGEGVSATGAPANYTNLITANSGTVDTNTTNVCMAGASRQLNAASEDPGVFTHPGVVNGWSAYTVAIHPASAVVAFLPRVTVI